MAFPLLLLLPHLALLASSAVPPAQAYAPSVVDNLLLELQHTRTELAQQRHLIDQLRQPALKPSAVPLSVQTESPKPGCGLCAVVPSLMLGFVLVGISKALASLGACSVSRANVSPCAAVKVVVGALMGAAVLATAFSLISSAFWLLSYAFPWVLFLVVPVIFTFGPPCRWSRRCRGPVIPAGEVLPAAPLCIGSKGPGVTQLQRQLILLGHMSPAAIKYHAGLFGPRTEQALIKVQQAMSGSAANGVYDIATQEQLTLELGLAASLRGPTTTTDSQQSTVSQQSALPTESLSRGARGPLVAVVQRALVQLEYMQQSWWGVAWGMFGPRTHEAICKVQQSINVAQTGVYDTAVRTQLEMQLEALVAATPAASAKPREKKQTHDARIAADSIAATPAPINTVTTKAAEAEAEQVHQGIWCDGCAMRPLRGPRFVRPTLGDTFDLCKDCYTALSHDEQASFKLARVMWPLRSSSITNTTAELPLTEEHPVEPTQPAAPTQPVAPTQPAAPTQALPVDAPARWCAALQELTEMGFDEERATDALIAARGEMKQAVKRLIGAERAARM